MKSIMAKFLPLGDPKVDSLASQVLVAALRRCQWFSRLPDGTLTALVECMEGAVYSTGDLISPAGSADSKLYYIARGAVLSTKVHLHLHESMSNLMQYIAAGGVDDRSEQLQFLSTVGF